jgi:hypothetical protein
MPMSLHDVIPSENHLLDDVAILLTYFGADPNRPNPSISRWVMPAGKLARLDGTYHMAMIRRPGDG